MESHIFWTFSDFGERSPMKIPESELILEIPDKNPSIRVILLL